MITQKSNQFHDGSSLSLQEDQIHVWSVQLGQLMPYVGHMVPFLSEGERSRASHYHFRRDRNRFITRRFVQRSILGWYLGVDFDRLRFGYGPKGKPFLTGEFGRRPIHFNLSSSGNLVVLALALNRKIGVDVERIRPIPEADQIATWLFSIRECDALSSLPPEQKELAFYNCWTRKEAYVKAIGAGLAQPLRRFAVSLRPEEPARFLYIDGVSKAPRWSLTAWTPAPGYVAALATEGQDYKVHYQHHSSFQ